MSDTSATKTVDSGCPNPTSVEKALSFADAVQCGGASDAKVALRMLAAEVRRLREDQSHRLSREDSIALKNELLAEVDKLRVADTRQMETLAAENERLQAVVADQALTIGTLKDTSARFERLVFKERDIDQKSMADLLKLKGHAEANGVLYVTALEVDNANWRQHVAKLREENATLRLTLDVALKEVERLRTGIDDLLKATRLPCS